MELVVAVSRWAGLPGRSASASSATALLNALGAAVRATSGGVLVAMDQPHQWPPGPLVLVRTVGRGPDRWFGPLDTEAEREALCAWVAGGCAASEEPPLPRRGAGSTCGCGRNVDEPQER